MNFLPTICIFIIVLFLYIYINHQFKKSEDLEIYEMDYSNNYQLQDVCDVRQPVLFEFKSIYPKLFSELSDPMNPKYGSYDVNIKDSNDYYKENILSVDSIILPMQDTYKILSKPSPLNGSKSHFIAEDNSEFLEDSGLHRIIKSADEYLKPDFTVHTKYDMLFGSANATTPLRYHTNNCRFISVYSGKLKIKMTPWKSNKFLDPIKDYENYEFRSPMNPWEPQSMYKTDFDKIQFLEFDVLGGNVLYMPPYWWYSIQYSDIPNTIAYSMTYSTVMNCISNLPDIVLYYLQQQNITKKIKKIPEPDVAAINISGNIQESEPNRNQCQKTETEQKLDQEPEQGLDQELEPKLDQESEQKLDQEPNITNKI